MTNAPTNPAQNLATDFSHRVLSWFWVHGRHDLPWQQHQKKTADIYAVWLSEIMLQQTQVTTVMDYFDRFIAAFPNVHALAQAEWDDVALLWAGLGYYARARNLHAGAKQLVDFIQTHGDFPQTTQDWQTIKGVGRSTAGAIVAMGVKGYGVICDGNVKRVLTRWAAIDDDITKSTTEKLLWELAHKLTPLDNSGHFAQAMMDLGATLCTRTKPKCTLCPVVHDCAAYAKGTPAAYPVKTKKPAKPNQHSLLIRLTHQQKTLWLKRLGDKTPVIWEGLWCFLILTIGKTAPTNTTDVFLQQTLKNSWHNEHCLNQAQFGERQIFELLASDKNQLTLQIGRTIKHTLTHFHWHLSLVNIDIDRELFECINQTLTACASEFVWQDGKTLAMPAAIKKILEPA